MNHLDKITYELYKELSLKENKNPLTINISGCMGSGKTTWATALANKFKSHNHGVTHVSEDDFLQPRAYRNDLKNIFYNQGEWKNKNYWEVHENWLRLDLMKQAMLNLSKMKSISYHPYERTTGTFGNKIKKVTPSPIIIFESSIFNELFDSVVLIDVDEKILLERKVGRDTDLRDAEKIKKYHNIAQLPFWNRHRPINPDIIINNNDMNNPVLIRKNI